MAARVSAGASLSLGPSEWPVGLWELGELDFRTGFLASVAEEKVELTSLHVPRARGFGRVDARCGHKQWLRGFGSAADEQIISLEEHGFVDPGKMAAP